MIEFILVVVLIFGGMGLLYFFRARELMELVQFGVDAKGTVTDKRSVPGGRSRTRQQKIVYTYTDAQGASHEHTSIVTYDEYNRYQVGDAIDIVYSSKRPSVSTPLYLIEAARKKKEHRV